MSDAAEDVSVVWVGEEGGPAEAADGREDAARALTGWARARGLTLVGTDGAMSGALIVDLSVADRVEKELYRAKEAIAALDADTADRALARAESLLREHPELPQAAWLRAEVMRSWSSRWMRVEPRDEARATSAWQDADALDGGRVPGVGETAAPPRAKVGSDIVVHGAANRKLVVRLDGADLVGRSAGDGTVVYAVEAGPTEHQLTVSLNGQPIFATWVSVAARASAGADGAPRAQFPIHVGSGASCSASAFANVTVDGAGVQARGVSCDRWVLAQPSARRGSVRVARCARETCGPLLEWRVESALGSGPPIATTPDRRWPAWATWTILGIGAATATTMALVATGVFETRPVEQRFINGGVRVE